MDDVKIKEQKALGDKWLFIVTIGQQEHEVTMSREYWIEQTNQKLTPGQFVLYAFMFLLDHESQDKILKEFDISDIQKYFSDFEQSLKE